MNMCLTCGQSFKTELEAIAHNEFWLKREEETRHYLYDDRNRHLFATRHVVQISQPVRHG